MTDTKAIQTSLLVVLLVPLALTAVYARTVVNVVRPIQVVMSVMGLAVYVFATGGWFATTTWYHAYFGAIALVVFALLVA